MAPMTTVSALLLIGVVLLAAGSSAADDVWPMPQWESARAAQVGMDEAKLNEAREYALTGDGTFPEVPRDAYWSWGLHDSFIIVIPSLDIVASRAGSDWKRQEGAAHYDVLRPFLGPIVASVKE